MNRDQLRTAQAPLKDRYREDPEAAVVTLHAEGALADSDVACSVQTGRALVEAGLHPASGGDGTFACSGDMLLQALVACAGVTLRSVATNRDILVRGTVRAEGDLDFRGTLGVEREHARWVPSDSACFRARERRQRGRTRRARGDDGAVLRCAADIACGTGDRGVSLDESCVADRNPASGRPEVPERPGVMPHDASAQDKLLAYTGRDPSA